MTRSTPAYLSASRIFSGAKPVFRDPLVADRPQVCRVFAPAIGSHQRDDGAGEGEADDDPDGIHGLFTIGARGRRWLNGLEQLPNALAAEHLTFSVFLKSCAIAISSRHLDLTFLCASMSARELRRHEDNFVVD